jgi:hypothetical protein
MSETDHVSNYARKHAWLSRNALWGFDVPEPKPWKKAHTGGQGSRPCRYAADVAEKIAAVLREWAEQAKKRGDHVDE